MLISFPRTHRMYLWCLRDSTFAENPTSHEVLVMAKKNKNRELKKLGSTRIVAKNENIAAMTPNAVIFSEIFWIFIFDEVSLKRSSSPWYLTLPSSTSQVASPMDTSEVTVFPHPDSPTRPIICPSSTFRSTEFRASTGPSRVSKWTLSPSISSTSLAIQSPPVLRVNHVPNAVTE